MSNFKDKAGVALKPGDLIVYGHALGRCAGLRYGVVLGFKEDKSWRATGGAKIKLKVQGVDDDWDHKKPSLIRASYLEFSERILKLNENQVPKKILDLLSEVGYGS